MEKVSQELNPISLNRDDPGIPIEWFHELNMKCTRWLRARGLYFETGEWKEEMRRRWNAERIANKRNKMDDFVDGLSED
jgi:hypothetical protein